MTHTMTIGAVAIMAFLAAGCGDRTDGTAAAASIGRTQSVDNSAAKPEHATRPYIGKPRPPLRVTLAPGTALAAGVPGTVSLLVRTGVPVTGLRIEVEGDAGLAVTAVGEQATLNAEDGRRAVQPLGNASTLALAVSESLTVPVMVTPTSGGTRHISGLVRFEVNGVEQGATFSVPLKVDGPVTVAPVFSKHGRSPFRDAAGEFIDSMPAETTVR